MTANGATRTTEEARVAHRGHLCQVKFGNGSDMMVGRTDQQGEYRGAEEKKWQTCQLPEMIRSTWSISPSGLTGPLRKKLMNGTLRITNLNSLFRFLAQQ